MPCYTPASVRIITTSASSATTAYRMMRNVLGIGKMRSRQRTKTKTRMIISGCKNAFMSSPLLFFLLLLRRSPDHMPGRIRLPGVLDGHMPAINRDHNAQRILYGLQLKILFVDLFLLVHHLFFERVDLRLHRDNRLALDLDNARVLRILEDAYSSDSTANQSG